MGLRCGALSSPVEKAALWRNSTAGMVTLIELVAVSKGLFLPSDLNNLSLTWDLTGVIHSHAYMTSHLAGDLNLSGSVIRLHLWHCKDLWSHRVNPAALLETKAIKTWLHNHICSQPSTWVTLSVQSYVIAHAGSRVLTMHESEVINIALDESKWWITILLLNTLL